MIRLKLVGQERVAREKLCDAETTQAIASFQSFLSEVKTIEDIRICEARAAAAYWRGWHPVEARFPQKDISRVPEHWRTLGSRTSPLSSFSPRVSAASQAKRTASSKRHMEGRLGWIAANQPAWLDQAFYVEKIQPLLAGLTSSSVASAIGVSLGYADGIWNKYICLTIACRDKLASLSIEINHP